MKKILKIAILVALVFALSKITAKEIYASEGTIEMRSTTGEDYRCFAASLIIQNYYIVVGCRELVYPSGAYVLWATSLDNGKAINLGTLDLGRKVFQTAKPFSELFVTLETNAGARSPAGAIVMRGTVKPITFLDRPTTPTPEPEGGEAKEGEVKEEGEEEVKEEKSTSTKEKLVAALKRAGVAAGFALVALVGLVFVITRGRS